MTERMMKLMALDNEIDKLLKEINADIKTEDSRYSKELETAYISMAESLRPYHDFIDVDTSAWDRIIWDLFIDCKISDQIEVNDCDVDLGDTKEMIALNKFDNLMCELLV